MHICPCDPSIAWTSFPRCALAMLPHPQRIVSRLFGQNKAAVFFFTLLWLLCCDFPDLTVERGTRKHYIWSDVVASEFAGLKSLWTILAVYLVHAKLRERLCNGSRCSHRTQPECFTFTAWFLFPFSSVQSSDVPKKLPILRLSILSIWLWVSLCVPCQKAVNRGQKYADFFRYLVLA